MMEPLEAAQEAALITRPEMFGYLVLQEYQDWRVWLSEKKGGHYYYIEQPDAIGSPLLYPSVTTCLSVLDKSQTLMRWAGKEAARYMADQVEQANAKPDRELLEQWIKAAVKAADKEKEEAGKAGTAAHLSVQLALLGTKVADDDYKNAVEAALQYLDIYKLNPLAAEVVTFHPKFHSPGSIDLVAETEAGNLVIVDWKRSKALYPEYRYQVAAYAGNVEAMTGKEVVGCYVFRLPRDGWGMDLTAPENVIAVTDWKADLDVYRKAQSLYYSLHLDRLKAMQTAQSVSE